MDHLAGRMGYEPKAERVMDVLRTEVRASVSRRKGKGCRLGMLSARSGHSGRSDEDALIRA